MPNVKMSDEFVEDESEAPQEAVEEILEEIVDTDELPLDYDEEYGIAVEDLDPEETIWEGGPSAGQIIEWKDKFGDVFVSSITPEYHVVWRTMNRLEYRKHVRNMEQVAESGQFSNGEASLLNEESICETCILYPPFRRDEMPKELAGVPSAIATDVLEASGFIALEVRKL